MKKSTASLLTGLSFLLVSCEIINPTKDECILLKTTWSIPNDPAHSSTDYQYNSGGELTAVVKSDYDLDPDPYITKWSLTYTNNKLDQIIASSKMGSDPEKTDQTFSFFYSGDQPDSIRYAHGQVFYFMVGYYTAVYSGKKLTRLVDYRYKATDTTYFIYNTTDIEWVGNNISKLVSKNMNGEQTTHEYTYDDKKTPLGHLGLAISTFGSFTMLSENNVVKSIRTLWDGSVKTIDNTLSYNAKDYPTIIDPSGDYPTSYSYDCK